MSFLNGLKRSPKIPVVLLASILISLGVIGLRNAGVLQGSELWLYDQLIKLRSSAQSDPRLLIVAIDDKTLKKINTNKISDRDLTAALKNLQNYKPAAIGIDIFRDIPIGEGRRELISYVNQVYTPLEGKIKPIIFTCSAPSAQQAEGIDPPDILDVQDSVGFANVEIDSDNIVRRVPISNIPVKTEADKSTIQEQSKEQTKVKSKCQGPFSLGFLTAASYLQSKNISLQLTAEQNLKLGDVIFKTPPAKAGAYQNLNSSLNQIILDYRLSKPAEIISLSEVLDDKISAAQIKDKVILIGYTTSSDDFHRTPYGMIPGIFIQAQAIEQVLATVLDKRPLVWFLSEPMEWLWITGWGILGGICAWRFRQTWLFYLSEMSVVGLLLGTTYIVFLQQGWFPLLPPILTILGSMVVVRSILPSKKVTLISPQTEVEPVTLVSPQTEVEPVTLVSPPTEVEPVTLVSPPTEVEPVTLVSPPTEVEPVTLVSLPTEVEPVTLVSPPTEVEPVFIKASQPTVKKAPFVGTLLGDNGRYVIEKLLGGGGMGQVYVASDTRLANRKVAIKVLTINNNVSNAKLLRRFQQEVKVMAKLTSPNIVKVSDWGITEEDSFFQGSPFYVMEYLKGRTLTEKIEQTSKIPIAEAIIIVRQICVALEDAHEQMIAHRDLKPDNIFLEMVGYEGEIVKVLDFGIAKVLNDGKDPKNSPRITRVGAFIGTYHYASPEQCRGDDNIDHRTDIYSLGLILYEMITGRNPFNLADEDTQADWIASHLRSEPVALRSQPKCKNIPSELEKIVMKCLAKQPENRYNNIKELHQALILH